jgi:hypothetical protein
MSLTREYTLTHQAVREVATKRELMPMDVRVLVAIADRGGVARTDELETDLGMGGSAVRRSLLTLRPRWCEGGDKRGARSPIRLTDDGWAAAHAVERRRRELAITNQEVRAA